MEVLSLLPKTCRVIKGDSESTRSSRAQDATLNSLDDAILPSANRDLQLQDAREELKAATGIEVTHLDICSFQERVGKPFIRLIKDNISSQFRIRSSSKDVLSAFSI